MAKDRLLSESATDTPKSEGFLGSANPGFDLAMWVQGFKPASRVIALYRDLDLIGDRDRLGIALDDARAARDDKRVEELRAEIREITARIEASRIEVRLQELAQSRRDELLEVADGTEDQGFAVVAAAIVEPAGFTVDVLKAFAEKSPAQAEMLAKTVNQLNSQVPNVRLTTPF